MDEDILVTEYNLDPQSFFTHIYTPEHENLREIALNGGLGRLRNRFICWRLFLGIFPESSPISSWISVCRTLRIQYYSIQDSYKVK